MLMPRCKMNVSPRGFMQHIFPLLLMFHLGRPPRINIYFYSARQGDMKRKTWLARDRSSTLTRNDSMKIDSNWTWETVTNLESVLSVVDYPFNRSRKYTLRCPGLQRVGQLCATTKLSLNFEAIRGREVSGFLSRYVLSSMLPLAIGSISLFSAHTLPVKIRSKLLHSSFSTR